MPPIHRPGETAALVRETFGCTPVMTAELEAVGITRKRLRSALAAGTLIRVRRGVVRVAGDEGAGRPISPDEGSPAVRAEHLQRAEAALLALADDSILSHGSAALAHGLPTFDRPPRNVWVSAPRHGRVVAGTHRRLAAVADRDRALVDGLPCTSVARTGLDLARRRPLHQSLVAIDAVLSRVGARELRATMARLEWVYDLPSLSLAVNSGDPLSESPLESMSRGWMAECGVPPPYLQRWVEGESGHRYRVDFLWPDRKVIGEADGMSKYAGIDDVRKEKLREDDLRRGLDDRAVDVPGADGGSDGCDAANPARSQRLTGMCPPRGPFRPGNRLGKGH